MTRDCYSLQLLPIDDSAEKHHNCSLLHYLCLYPPEFVMYSSPQQCNTGPLPISSLCASSLLQDTVHFLHVIASNSQIFHGRVSNQCAPFSLSSAFAKQFGVS